MGMDADEVDKKYRLLEKTYEELEDAGHHDVLIGFLEWIFEGDDKYLDKVKEGLK